MGGRQHQAPIITLRENPSCVQQCDDHRGKGPQSLRTHALQVPSINTPTTFYSS